MSSWQSTLRRESQKARDRLRETVGLIVKLLPYSRSTSDGVGDKVQGYPTEGSDEKQYDYDGRRIFPFGLRSVPPKGVLAAWIGLAGDSGNGLIIGAESSRFGPSGLNDGEVALYNKISGVSVLLDKNGAVTVTDKGGNKIQLDGSSNINITGASGTAINISTTGANVNVGGALIVLNNGTEPVARVGDATSGHTHGFSLSAGPYGVGGTIANATDTIHAGNTTILG